MRETVGGCVLREGIRKAAQDQIRTQPMGEWGDLFPARPPIKWRKKTTTNEMEKEESPAHPPMKRKKKNHQHLKMIDIFYIYSPSIYGCLLMHGSSFLARQEPRQARYLSLPKIMWLYMWLYHKCPIQQTTPTLAKTSIPDSMLSALGLYKLLGDLYLLK
jgi:hypothetical protein